MSQPFLGSLMLVSFNFAPKGWTMCAGQLLAINQNQALFSLLGTTYGGDGRVTFGLPDLRGRTPVMADNSTIQLGQKGGEESHTLTSGEVPAHNHLLQATTNAASSGSPTGDLLGTTSGNVTPYKQSAQLNAQLAPGTVPPAGGSQPHENRQPFLAMTWIIALQGIFPSRN